MKKFIPVCMLVMLLSACKTVEGPHYYTLVSAIDYYSVGLNGKILLTESNSISGDYESLGSIVVAPHSGYEVLEAKTTSTEVVVDDGIYGAHKESKSETKYKTGKWKTATYQSALEEAVKKAVEMGGDAIINLKLTTQICEPYVGKFVSEPVVTGMVIKRK